MADPNFIVPDYDDPCYTPYTDDFMNIMDNLNPSLPAGSPLIPQYSEKSKDAMDIGSSEALDFWDLYNESDVRYSPVNPFGINGKTSNQMERNLGNESLNNLNIPILEDLAIQESFSFPLPIHQSGEKSKATTYIDSLLEDPVPEYSQSDPTKINWGMSNQRETNLGNKSVNNPNLPTPEDLYVQEPFSFPSLIPPFTEERGEAIDPVQKTIISWGMCNASNVVNSQASCSKTYGETSNQRETNLGTPSLDNMNSRQLSVWPSAQVPFGCSCCEILREIIHIKGCLVMKLQIHGRLVGIFFHAVLDVQLSSKSVSHEMFDFYEKSFEEVKQFLTQYCIKRKQEGYTMMKDPRSTFFEALCIGFDWDENLSDGDYTEKTLSPDPGDIQMDEAANDSNNQEKPPLSLAEQVVATASNEAANSNNKEKSPISLTEQRKRVKESKEMTFKDLANYFQIPRKEAARKLGLSETVVHNIWCKNGGGKRRWPYRKVHSLEKEISELRALSNSDDPHERVRARNEIKGKEEEMGEFYKESA